MRLKLNSHNKTISYTPYTSLFSGFSLKSILITIVTTGLLLSQTSCSSLIGDSDVLDSTHFYSLSSLPSTTNNHSKLRIGVGPIVIPRLLNRPQIVSRKNNTEIQMSESHQWGGSFKEELIQSITDNLSSLLKTDNIEQYPWKFSFKPKYQIRIDIERLDGQKGKKVLLKARWRLLKNNKEILVKRAIINTPIQGKSYASYVKAQSQALITLSKQISQQIK